MQFGHECLRATEHARARADLMEELHEQFVAHRMIVGEHFAHFARIGKPAAFRHAQKETRKPVRKGAADHEQMAVLEFVEQLARREMLRLQRADKLHRILVGDHIRRRGGELAEQMIDHGPRELRPLGTEIGHAVWRVGDHLGRLRAAEAHLVDRTLEQRVERRRDEQVEVRNLRELPQRGRRRKRRLAQDRADARVGIFASAASAEIRADHVVEIVALGRTPVGTDSRAASFSATQS